MFQRVRRGWTLTKASFRVLEKDREILVLPVLSFLTLVGALGLWGLAGWATVGAAGLMGSDLGYVWLFGAYVTVAFVGTFFLAATIEMASLRLGGSDPTLADGLSKAWAKKGNLLAWALVTATVGVLLRVLRRRSGGMGNLLGAFLEFGWAVATFLAVPVLVHRDVGPIQAVKDSGGLVKAAWGEAATGVVGTGIVFFLLGLLGLAPVVVGVLAGSVWVLAVGGIVAVAWWVVLAAANSAVSGILKAALFQYADTGQMPEGFEAASRERLPA